MSKEQNLVKDPKALHIGGVIHWAFNINQNIRVKLFDKGYERLAELHNSYIGTIPNWKERNAEYYKKQADNEGYTSFQMWCFMEYFGEVTRIGTSDYYHPTLLIEPNGIEPCV
jgi:hypothetical protein